MTTYEVGQVVTFSVKVTDSAGVAANTGTTPVCTVTLPDGSTALATITNPATGTYQGAYTSTQAGRHRARWTATGLNSGGFPYSDVADVWPTDPRMVIGLADARAELNATTGITANDDEIRLFIVSATVMLEDIGEMLGIAILPKTVTEDHAPHTELLALRHTPVGAVTTVTEYEGTTATVIAAGATPGASGDTYTLDASTGVLVRRSGGYRTPWNGEVRVVYTWGSTTVAPNVITAARALVAHVTSIGQRGPRRGMLGGAGSTDDLVVTPMGFAVPNRVVQMLNPSGTRAAVGIA